jgi:hypothetical protein
MTTRHAHISRRSPPEVPRPAVRTPSDARKHLAGIVLFLVVTAWWVLGLVSAERDWITWRELDLLIATVLSAASVVLTGYLGETMDAVWLGWIPGAVIMAVGSALRRPTVKWAAR